MWSGRQKLLSLENKAKLYTSSSVRQELIIGLEYQAYVEY